MGSGSGTDTGGLISGSGVTINSSGYVLISGISDGVAGSTSTSGMRFDGNSGGVVNVAMDMVMDMVDDLIGLVFKIIRLGFIGVVVLYNLWADFESRIDFLRKVTVINETD